MLGIRASQYRDFAALRGDPSDNLPGVRGIGPRPRRSCWRLSVARRPHSTTWLPGSPGPWPRSAPAQPAGSRGGRPRCLVAELPGDGNADECRAWPRPFGRWRRCPAAGACRHPPGLPRRQADLQPASALRVLADAADEADQAAEEVQALSSATVRSSSTTRVAIRGSVHLLVQVGLAVQVEPLRPGWRVRCR